MNLKTLILFVTLTLSASQLLAQKAELLTFDKNKTDENGMPRNFRDLSQFGLNAIASGQFSEKELNAVKEKYPNKKIIIVDLRRESHGLINGISVSWREQFDKSNSEKDVSKVLRDEKSRLNLAKKTGRILVNRIIEDDKKNGWYSEVKPEIVDVTNVSTEEDLAKRNGFEYKRFLIQDHAKPDEKQFNEMVSFIKNLTQDKELYVHCAAGKGRTTTFLVIYDIIKNGKEMKLEKILERHNKAGGSKLDNVEDEDGVKWRNNLAQEKLKLVKQFYEENLKKNPQK